MGRNNFQQLEEEELDLNRGPSDYVKNSVRGTAKSMNLFGNMIDHFLPKMFRLIVSLLGGGNTRKTKENISFQSSDAEPENSHSKPEYPNRHS